MAAPDDRDIVELDAACPWCGGNRFVRGRVYLKPTPLWLVDWSGWFDGDTQVLMCTRCGYLHWFGRPVEGQGPRACLGCGAAMDEGAFACPSCGWSPGPTDGGGPAAPRECLACRAPMEPDDEVCRRCGWSYWGDKGDDLMVCLECGTTIPADTSRCPSCGWTYLASDAADDGDKSGS